jgi:hypothetical protein
LSELNIINSRNMAWCLAHKLFDLERRTWQNRPNYMATYTCQCLKDLWLLCMGAR